MTEVKKRKKKAISVEFIGGKRFISGIPARNLTIDEWKDMPRKTQKQVLEMGLYEVKYD